MPGVGAFLVSISPAAESMIHHHYVQEHAFEEERRIFFMNGNEMQVWEFCPSPGTGDAAQGLKEVGDKLFKAILLFYHPCRNKFLWGFVF